MSDRRPDRTENCLTVETGGNRAGAWSPPELRSGRPGGAATPSIRQSRHRQRRIGGRPGNACPKKMKPFHLVATGTGPARACDAGLSLLPFRMAPQNVYHDCEARLLAAGHGCALVSAFLPGLPNTLLVQAVVLPTGGSRLSSLHVVYREAMMTFDAVVAFDPGQACVALDEALLEYVRSDDFAANVMQPLSAEIRAHFDR